MYRLLFIYTSLPHTFQAKKKLEVGNFLPDMGGGMSKIFFLLLRFIFNIAIAPSISSNCL